MKPIHAKFTSVAVVFAALALGTQALNVYAQASAPGASTSRAAARKANHRLESAVLKALVAAKIDVVDIRVIAKHGDVGLDGEVTNASDIQTAESVASKVPGVNSVKNYLSVFEGGAH